LPVAREVANFEAVAAKTKPTRFRLTEFQNRAGSTSWRVAGTKPDGTRIRKNYPKKSDALRELSDLELEAEGTPEPLKPQRTFLSTEQISDAEAAVRHAGGRSLARIVTHYHDLEARAKARNAGLDAAISFFEERYKPEVASITLLNAVSKFKAGRKGITSATAANYSNSLKLLLKTDPNKPVHQVRVEDLDQVLSRYSNTGTRRSHRRIFSIFFNWARRYRYCSENPCDRLDKIAKETSQIQMLSLEEVERLLVAAVTYQNGIAAAGVAISLFAGLRPSELGDLKPTDLTANRIRVTGGKLRRKLNRSVPIPPVLAAWLAEFPFKGLPDGWIYKMKVLKRATNASRWVNDIIRHTSISFQAERDKDEALTAFNCGTSKAMMDRNYRNSIDDPEVIERFWNLTPDLVGKLLKTEVKLPSAQRVEWPTEANLRKLVWKLPMSRAAKTIGVSDVALRKRCLSLGIPLPPRGRWITGTKKQNGSTPCVE
jgi:integrase